jgi:hypothetical protein
MVPVYQTTRGLLFGLRFLVVFGLLCLAGSLWWGLDLTQTYGLNPGDGGELAPLPARLAWAGVVVFLGVALAVGLWLMASLYIVRIAFDPDRKQVYLDTFGFFRNRKYVVDRTAIGSVRTHPQLVEAPPRTDKPGLGGKVLKVLGKVLMGLLTVCRVVALLGGDPRALDDHSGPRTGSDNPPWKSVRLAGRRLPLVLVTQGVVLHADLLQDLFGDREAAAPGGSPPEKREAGGDGQVVRAGG